MSTPEPEDFDSTLVRRGAQATTFTDMTNFVAEIQERPIAKLIFELPELARLSDVKFALARQSVRRRLETLPSEEREAIREIVDSVADTIGSLDAQRIRSVFVQNGRA